MYPPKRLLSALLTVAVYCAGAAAASAITITGNNVQVLLQSTAGNATNSFSGTNLPTSQLVDVTLGAFYSRAQIDYTGSGDNVTLLNTFNQKRSGSLGDRSQGYDNSLFFTAGATTTFALSGAYSAIDASTPGLVYLYSYLKDVTTSATLALSLQYSFSTHNESLVLGGNGGDQYNNTFGSLTGSLIAGHQYEWFSNAYTQAYLGADGGVTAAGFIRLDIGGGAPSSVPDGGASLTMLGLTVLFLGAYRGRVACA